MEQEKDNIISSIIERLDKIEAEMSRIKTWIPPSKERARVTAQPPPADSVKKAEKAGTVPSGTASLENVIGTRWIGRIGMLAVIFGIAFFLKYSFDNKLIGETGRIILGIFWGICFIGFGEYFQKKKNWNIYGQIFTGGGITILYFSIYAAFAFYHLVSQILAFAALIVITTTGVTLSVRYSARSIAVIGILGGFLTPVMLSTGENRPISLFSYILLLDAGILSVVYLKQWRSIGIVSLIGTIFLYLAWHGRFYTIEQESIAFGIVTVFFIFYNLYVFLASAKNKTALAEQLIIFISAAFYFLSFNAQNQYVNNWNLKSFVLAMSFVEILFALLIFKMNPVLKNIIYSFAGASVVLNVIAIFIVFEKEWITAALAAEMVIFAFMGIRLDKPSLRLAAYILGMISLVRFFKETGLVLGPFDKFIPLINSRFIICSFVIAAFYVLLYLLNKNRESLQKNEAAVIPGVLIITQFLSVFMLSMEFYDFYRLPSAYKYLEFADVRYARQLSLSVVWALYASVVIGVGILRKIKLLRIFGIVLSGITVLKVFFFDLSELRTIYRIVSFIILGLLLLGVSYLYNRYKHRIFGED